MTSQIARMLRVESLGRAPVSPTEHRLGGSLMMFMKFARPADVRVQVSGMAKGWYVPAVYADALIEAGRAIGSRGGATFTLKNLDRWLSNEQFTHLARDGWIGSVGVRAAALRDYIDTALAERRSVMLMESSTTYPT
ncbi:hypothetical protein G5V59_12940 [Nocardioides sp. W3-2-3]|uniref:hypothetical protein n=1 Tax=Nocardioides convexus TaxID=2712224 RepID=UPI00241826B9|nr:hypothetical protein [Nocardioides convexus]NHA00620.1 hypothetical protein [Nocardioides convexus]